MRYRLEIQPKEQNISVALDFIKERLTHYRSSKNETVEAMLMAEETLVTLLRETSPSENIELEISQKFGKVFLKIKSKGAQLEESQLVSKQFSFSKDAVDENTEYAIRSIFMRRFAKRIQNSYKAGTNYLKIILVAAENYKLKITMLAFVVAIISGIILRLLAPEVGDTLCDYLFEPATTIFINTMKCIITPLIFFSICASIISFDDMKVLGRLGAKVFSLYLFTSVMAVVIGFALFNIFNPGEFGSIVASSYDVERTQVATFGLKEIIINLFSSNAIDTFLRNDTLQIIIIAILLGIGIMSAGEKGKALKEFIDSTNAAIISLISKVSIVIPFVVFCTMTKTVLQIDVSTIVSLLYILGLILLSFLTLQVIYALLILVTTRLNPLILAKRYIRTALNVMAIRSSNAMIPLNLEFSKSIGVSEKLASFSIPLGATINMDAASICYVIAGLFFSKVYGVNVPPSMYLGLMLTVLALAMGAPGVTGANITIMMTILALLGCPAEAIVLYIGIDTILDMFETASNTYGDQVITLIVAKNEKLLDESKYKS